jgi:two-component sensor histidine kinase
MECTVKNIERSFSLLAIFAFLCVGCSNFEPGRATLRGPQAQGGVLDLRAWDFERQGAVSLGGEWDFAPSALLDTTEAAVYKGWVRRAVPDFWKGSGGGEGGDLPGTGYGTYRLRVLLPRDAPPLALRNHSGFNAFELEVSGLVVARVGKPAADRGSSFAAYRPGVSAVYNRPASMTALGAPGTSELELLFRTSNWVYRGGGIWKPLVLGDASALSAEQQRSGFREIALAATMAALALNSLIIFVNRRKERSYLFFALFGFVLALRPLVTGEYVLAQLFPSIPFDLLVRLEYASAMLAMPAAMAFFLSFFPTGKPRFWHLVLVAPFAPFVPCMVLLPLYWLTWTIFAFYAVSILAMVLAASTVLARAVYRRVQGGLPMFTGGCILAVCAVNDMLHSSHIVSTLGLFPIALVLFIFLQCYVLARRFSSAFSEVEHLSGELKGSNEMLRNEIRNAMEASARLEESLSEKEMLLKEVHHRVKNSLQIVSSIAALQANRTDEPAAAAMSRSIRERIRVISLANERLYDVDSGDMIDLVDYARDVLNLAVSSYGSEDCRIEARVESAFGRVMAESAVVIDFGLVLTELVVNSLKHALLPRRGGSVVVSIRGEGDSCRFEVRDDGPGFPAGFDPASARSLGFKIVVALLKRRGGSLSLSKGSSPTIACSMRLGATDQERT